MSTNRLAHREHRIVLAASNSRLEELKDPVEALIRVMQQTSVPLTADCLRVCESQLDRHTADATTCVPVKSQLTAQTGASVRGTLERRDTLPTIVYTPCTITRRSKLFMCV